MDEKMRILKMVEEGKLLPENVLEINNTSPEMAKEIEE